MTAARHFAQEFDDRSLHTLYEDHISLTSAIGIDRLNRNLFEQRLFEEIAIVGRKAKAGSYKFSQYKEKLISKGAGKHPRVISIPTFRDRITLRALCNVLRRTFEEEIDTKLPQHVIENLRNELRSGKYSHFLKLDVTNFYPSIQHNVLAVQLKRRVRKKEIIQLITSAIQTPTLPFPDRLKNTTACGVPQGLAISNVLAEIYLAKFDKWAMQIENVAYFRYVDDVLILTQDEPTRLFELIKSKLEVEYGLVIHALGSAGKSEIGTVRDRFQFLGYEFRNGFAGVKADSIRRLEASLAKIFTTYKYRKAAASAISIAADRNEALTKARKIFLWRLNLRITGCIFDSVRRGWVFYFSQIDPTSLAQLHHLDKTTNVLARRFSVAFHPKEIRSFARTLHETARSNAAHRYIPNFDTTSLATQREILEMYGMENVGAMTDEQVNRSFKRRIRRETSELELDIQGVS